MLNPNYRYIGIDFETTGLDTKKDVPIQIGIVEINSKGEIIDSFDSLIQPQKDVQQLKNIVSFITKIEIAQLVFAPNIEEIAQHIQHFFAPNVIIIGHNINFDLAFLKKVLPEFQQYASFDTFQLAQALVPYPSSYALEILMQHLEDKPLFLEWKSKFGLPFSTNKGEHKAEESENFHDALYDAKSTLTLFCYLISFIRQMEEKQPIIKQFLVKSDALLSTLLRGE